MLRQDKGQDDLLRAMRAIAERGGPMPVALVIGSPTSETKDYADHLTRLVGELGGTDHVRFLGYRDDVARLMPGIDFLVVPSRTEAQSRVVPQAFACGRPAVPPPRRRSAACPS